MNPNEIVQNLRSLDSFVELRQNRLPLHLNLKQIVRL